MTVQSARETLFLHNAEMGLGAWSWGDRSLWNYGRGYTAVSYTHLTLPTICSV